MRFMMLIKSNAQAEAGVLPDEELLTAMGRYNEELVKAGVLLGGEGLQASSKGVRVRLIGNKAAVVDGPFAEAKELVAGYWMLTVKSKEEAIAWAKRVPGPAGEIELRLLYEVSDFPADPAEASAGSEGWREQEQRFRDGTAPSHGPAAAPIARQPKTKRFLVMLKSDAYTESGVLPDPQTLAAMGGLMEDLARTGALLAGEGLKPSAHGARIKFSGDKRTLIDGPFSETKEMIAGFTMIQMKTMQDAIAFAERWLRIHDAAVNAQAGEIEIRQVFETSDFPVDAAEKPDGWRAREEAMRQTLGSSGS